MTVIELSEDAACSVYRTLRGESTPLCAVIEESRAARQRGTEPVWRVPVTSTTVHRLEGLFLLARDEPASFEIGRVGVLSERERAFLQDFKQHRLHQTGEDQASSFTLMAHQAAEMAEELAYLLPAMAGVFGGRAPALPAQLRDVLIIGAYGGDHVGDAAILGGVLLTLHQQYGVTSAKLLSHRPEHTRRLAAALVTPVSLTVHHYNAPTAKLFAAEADALVIAGGPLMDLPRVLAKHLVAAASARKHRKPLIVERVGVGPFKREASVRAARILLKQAARISTRTSKAAQHPIARGLNVSVGRDPAFDYLATRAELSRLTAGEKQSVDDLLVGTQDRLIIGINVRPIRHMWSPKGESFSEQSEDQFIDQLASAMRNLSKLVSKPVTYVFFPMNPIQFGMSDLASAYRIHRLVERDVDFRIWEADPDVDGVLYMIRNFHMALSMRFHACIFALSQEVPVIGIDYYPGQGGKVEQLFQDFGLGVDVRVMDNITTEWLLDRFRHHIRD